MNRSEILDAAKQVVSQRQVLHGVPENCFAEIAEHWTTYILGKTSLTAHDACMMMVLFKVVRAKATPSNTENSIDGCGYFACGSEVATQGGRDIKPTETKDINCPCQASILDGVGSGFRCVLEQGHEGTHRVGPYTSSQSTEGTFKVGERIGPFIVKPG